MALKKFDIFSPILGIKEDQPGVILHEAFMPDNRNIMLRNGEATRVRKPAYELKNGGTQVQTPDGNPVLKYHYFEKSDGNNYLLAFTADSIYHWNTSTSAWDEKSPETATEGFDLVGSATYWSVCTFNDTVIACNGVGFVLEWSGSGNFSALDDAAGTNGIETVSGTTYIASAKHVANFENHLILGAVKVGAGGGAGTWYNSAIYWCDIGDKDEWKTVGAGNQTIEGPDQITGFGTFSDFLMIFKENSIIRMWLTDDPTLIFGSAAQSRTIGCPAPDSITAGEIGELYFFAQDNTIRVIIGITGEMPIVSKNIVKILELVPNTYVSTIRAHYSTRYRQLMFSLAVGADSTGNNTVMILADGAWTRHDVTVYSFGEYERDNATYTIDTIPYSTIDGIEWETIDGVDKLSGYRTDLISDASGYTYTMFGSETDSSGSDYTGYLILGTDFTPNKGPVRDGVIANTYKRLLYVQPYFRYAPLGTVTISVKNDLEYGFNDIGTIDLSTKQNETNFFRIPCDQLGKHFQIKISCDTKFTFLGIRLEYVTSGER